MIPHRAEHFLRRIRRILIYRKPVRLRIILRLRRTHHITAMLDLKVALRLKLSRQIVASKRIDPNIRTMGV